MAKLEVGINDLKTSNPELAKEWHPTKNGDLKPEDCTASSEIKVWWYLPYDDPRTGKHFDFEWQSIISNRNKGVGCPFISNPPKAVWPGFNDLATNFPALAKEWHPTKNGNLKPTDCTVSSSKIVWWFLPYDDPKTGKHFDFEWQSSICSRTKGVGCPYLSIPVKAIYPGFNDLATLYPNLAKEWHHNKNGDLLPENVSAGSPQKVWWLLPYDDPKTGKHFDFEWKAQISSRTTGNMGCPFLSNQAVWPGFNDLATTNPELAKEWHPTKNGDITPEMVSAGSNKKAWWYLPYDDPKTGKHFVFEWEALISSRNKGTGCPYLSYPAKAIYKGFNDLATTNPEIAKEWHPNKNGSITPDAILAGTDKKYWWLGKCGHEWKAAPASRLYFDSGCPKCNSERHTSFPEQAILYYISRCVENVKSRDNSIGCEIDIFLPSYNVGIEYDGGTWHQNLKKDVAKNEFCETKGIKLYRIRENDSVKLPDKYNDQTFYYEYGNDEALSSSIKSLCSTIFGKKIDVDTKRDRAEIHSQYILGEKKRSFMYEYPDLAKEWDYEKNGLLTPDKVTKSSGKKVWWIGKCGHGWEASIAHRVRGRSCPICSRNKLFVGFNDLVTENPELAKEWHPTKNGNLKPEMVSVASSKKVWWLGKCGHEWESKVYNRYNGRGCPICANKIRGRKRSRKVLNTDTGIIYESLTDAERKTGINRMSIGNVCKRKYNTAGGYHWKYIED